MYSARGVTSAGRSGLLLENFSDDAGHQWGLRAGFNQPQLKELRTLIGIIKPLYVSPREIQTYHVIAKGSFGTVFFSNYRGTLCAVKRILQKGDKRATQNLRDIFLELSAMQNLDHPNVIKLSAVGMSFPQSSDQEMYMGLEEILHKKKLTLSHVDKIIIAQEVMNGVGYLHSMGIIHRDLSTENILLGADGHLRVADFGCARKMPKEGEYFSSTISGSPAYMPPEQIQGNGLTLKVDVWAIGVMLWEILCQKFPWAEFSADRKVGGVEGLQTIKETLVERKCQLPAAPQGNFPSGPFENYNRIIGQAMQWAPESRPSMQELLIEMQETVCEPSHVIRVDGSVRATSVDSVVRQSRKKAQLMQQLALFYTDQNPGKISEVPKVAAEYLDNEDELNRNLYQRYKADLRSVGNNSSRQGSLVAPSTPRRSNSDTPRGESPYAHKVSASPIRSQPPPQHRDVRDFTDSDAAPTTEKDSQLRTQDQKIQVLYAALADKEKELAARRRECEQLKVEVEEARMTHKDLEQHLIQQQQENQDAITARDRLIQEERNRYMKLQKQLVDMNRHSEFSNGRPQVPNPAELPSSTLEQMITNFHTELQRRNNRVDDARLFNAHSGPSEDPEAMRRMYEELQRREAEILGQRKQMAFQQSRIRQLEEKTLQLGRIGSGDSPQALSPDAYQGGAIRAASNSHSLGALGQEVHM